MEFGLTSEQKNIREAVANFVKSIDRKEVNNLDAASEFPFDIYQQG